MTKNKPQVSIGMPIYNAEKYLKEAIDSLLSQSFKDFELIISDNASYSEILIDDSYIIINFKNQFVNISKCCIHKNSWDLIKNLRV